MIQAAAVKLMKTRKDCKYMTLVTDTVGMIAMFRAEPAMVKE